MKPENKKELESRIDAALKEAEWFLPVHRSASNPPYYNFNKVNRNDTGKYRMFSFRYDRELFEDEHEPNVDSFEKAFSKFYAKLIDDELSLYVKSYREFMDSEKKIELTEEEKKAKLLNKTIRVTESPNDSFTPDATRMRVFPYKRKSNNGTDIDMNNGENNGGNHEWKEPSEAKALITASLDTKTKRVFFSYKKEDDEARKIISAFMIKFLYGRNRWEPRMIILDARTVLEHGPDSTITYRGYPNKAP